MSEINKNITTDTPKKEKTKYAFRAECRLDVDNFVKLSKVDQKDIEITPDDSGLPDCDVILYSEQTLDDIRTIMEEIEDSHVMLESLNYEKDYTGDRWYRPYNIEE